MKCSEQSLNRVKLHCSTWSDGAACDVNLDSSFPESIRASQCSERVLPEIPATGKLRKLGWGDHLSQREGVGTGRDSIIENRVYRDWKKLSG